MSARWSNRSSAGGVQTPLGHQRAHRQQCCSSGQLPCMRCCGRQQCWEPPVAADPSGCQTAAPQTAHADGRHVVHSLREKSQFKIGLFLTCVPSLSWRMVHHHHTVEPKRFFSHRCRKQVEADPTCTTSDPADQQPSARRDARVEYKSARLPRRPPIRNQYRLRPAPA